MGEDIVVRVREQQGTASQQYLGYYRFAAVQGQEYRFTQQHVGYYRFAAEQKHRFVQQHDLTNKVPLFSVARRLPLLPAGTKSLEIEKQRSHTRSRLMGHFAKNKTGCKKKRTSQICVSISVTESILAPNCRDAASLERRSGAPKVWVYS